MSGVEREADRCGVVDEEDEKSYTLRESTSEDVRMWDVCSMRREERVERDWALSSRVSMFCWIWRKMSAEEGRTVSCQASGESSRTILTT